MSTGLAVQGPGSVLGGGGQEIGDQLGIWDRQCEDVLRGGGAPSVPLPVPTHLGHGLSRAELLPQLQSAGMA